MKSMNFQRGSLTKNDFMICLIIKFLKMSDHQSLLSLIDRFRLKNKSDKNAVYHINIFYKNISELNKNYIEVMMFVFRTYKDELQKLFLQLLNTSKFFIEFFEIEKIILFHYDEILENNFLYYYSSKNKVYDFIFRVIKICNKNKISTDKYDKKLFDLSVKNKITNYTEILKYLLDKNKNLSDSPVSCYYTIFDENYENVHVINLRSIYYYNHEYSSDYLSSSKRIKNEYLLLW